MFSSISWSEITEKSRLPNWVAYFFCTKNVACLPPNLPPKSGRFFGGSSSERRSSFDGETTFHTTGFATNFGVIWWRIGNHLRAELAT